jgi:hypothetical protein
MVTDAGRRKGGGEDGEEKRRKTTTQAKRHGYSPGQVLQDLFQPGLFHPIFHDRDRPLIRRCCSCHARF